MPAEVVVDALRKLHRTLRPGGVLLDIHPRAMPSTIEVRGRDGPTPLGQIEFSPRFNTAISNAEQALASTEAEGLFAGEQQAEFPVLYHFDSALQWLDYLTSQAAYYVPPDEAVVEAVRGAMAMLDAEMLMSESVRATRFRRAG